MIVHNQLYSIRGEKIRIEENIIFVDALCKVFIFFVFSAIGPL